MIHISDSPRLGIRNHTGGGGGLSTRDRHRMSGNRGMETSSNGKIEDFPIHFLARIPIAGLIQYASLYAFSHLGNSVLGQVRTCLLTTMVGNTAIS